MTTRIFKTISELGKEAAALGAEAIRRAVKENGSANIILATGASQMEMLNALVRERVDWSRVNCYHLDEYIGISVDHPASFCKYLQERFVDKVGSLASFNFVRPDLRAPEEECRRLGDLISKVTIHVAFIGIGENGHLAFNDPPADFSTEVPFLVVDLDEGCRKQQLGEGWFKTLDDVPRKAITMSIRQIMKSEQLIVTVPDKRKAQAVKNALEGEVSPMCPASLLQEHPACTLFLDKESASLCSL